MNYPLVNRHNYGKSQLLMGKSTVSMGMFNSYVKLPESTHWDGKKYLSFLDSDYPFIDDLFIFVFYS